MTHFHSIFKIQCASYVSFDSIDLFMVNPWTSSRTINATMWSGQTRRFFLFFLISWCLQLFADLFNDNGRPLNALIYLFWFRKWALGNETFVFICCRVSHCRRDGRGEEGSMWNRNIFRYMFVKAIQYLNERCKINR